MGEIVGQLLALGEPHRYRIGNECGEVFADDEDFEGITLTIEVESIEDGERLVAAIEADART